MLHTTDICSLTVLLSLFIVSLPLAISIYLFYFLVAFYIRQKFSFYVSTTNTDRHTVVLDFNKMLLLLTRNKINKVKQFYVHISPCHYLLGWM